MYNFDLDIERLDKIMNKTIDRINNGKSEIYDIAENSRKDCNNLGEELERLKKETREYIEHVEYIEECYKQSKWNLMFVSKSIGNFSDEEVKSIYEETDNLRIQLSSKREQEQFLMKKRNDLETKIKSAYKTIQKADSLYFHIGSCLDYLTGGLFETKKNMTHEFFKEINVYEMDKNKAIDETGLTDRELEVLKLVAEGLLNKEIADKLNISEKTVKNHVSSVFKKLNVYDRTQATIFMYKNKLI